MFDVIIITIKYSTVPTVIAGQVKPIRTTVEQPSYTEDAVKHTKDRTYDALFDVRCSMPSRQRVRAVFGRRWCMN